MWFHLHSHVDGYTLLNASLHVPYFSWELSNQGAHLFPCRRAGNATSQMNCAQPFNSGSVIEMIEDGNKIRFTQVKDARRMT